MSYGSVTGTVTVQNNPAIDAAFEIVPCKNLYNPALAVNGKILSYASGGEQTYANGSYSGRIPVNEGTTYTISMLGQNTQLSPTIYFWSGDTYIGTIPQQGQYPTPECADDISVIVSLVSGKRRLTFTIPSGSNITHVAVMTDYVVHTSDEFRQWWEHCQLEVGTAVTTFTAWGTPPTAIIRDDATNGVLTKVEHQEAYAETSMPLLTQVSGDDIYVRSRFNNTHDIVHRYSTSGSTSFNNNVPKQCGTCLIDRYTAPIDTSTAYTYGLFIQSNGADDVCPLYYNGTYIGGNHGPACVRSVVSVEHGKTISDVGSSWLDGASNRWYIVRIVDDNNLWLVRETGMSGTTWTLSTTLTGSTLVHDANATHTSDIIVSSSTVTQLTPAIRCIGVRVMADNTEVTGDGLYRARKLSIASVYDVLSLPSVLEYIVSQVGSDIMPAYNHASIDADARVSVCHVFQPGGSDTIYSSVMFYADVLGELVSHIQASKIADGVAGSAIHMYVPGVAPITGSIKTWDFSTLENITTFEPSPIVLAPATWNDSGKPPYRFAQLIIKDGQIQYGYTVGYSPLRLGGYPGNRAPVVDRAASIHTTKKIYPAAVYKSSNTISAGSLYEAVAFHNYICPERDADATICTWYEDGADIVVMLDYHKNMSHHSVTALSKFAGRTIVPVDVHANVTVHNSVVSADGIMLSVTNGYGYAVLKLTN